MKSLRTTVYINQKDPGYEANVRFSVHLSDTPYKHTLSSKDLCVILHL